MVRLICYSHNYELTCYEKHYSKPTAHPSFPIPCHLLPRRHLHGHISRTYSVLWGIFGLVAAWLAVFLWEPGMQCWTQALLPQDRAHACARLCGRIMVSRGYLLTCGRTTRAQCTCAWAACDGCAAVLATAEVNIDVAFTCISAALGSVKYPNNKCTTQVMLLNYLNSEHVVQAEGSQFLACCRPGGGPDWFLRAWWRLPHSHTPVS